jgi:class 3 adenylate cyclase/tetratricopeptide (TPR) repeat protein
MICPTCGTSNEEGRKFCRECGSHLQAACPNCGTPNDADAKFCGECGTALAGTALTTTAAGARSGSSTEAPAAERRLVSVLFADLVGSTSIAESRDPEAVRELQSDYFEACRQVVNSYGGTVEKFIGDAVMAVWGTPVAFEDDAERAVRTALDLVEAVQALGKSLDIDLQVRAGVLTGEAAVTLGATNQGMVSGDLVNTAARLQSVAPPGTVLVGRSTYEAASGAIAFEPAGEQTLKGKSSPIPAFRALRVIARRGGAGRSEQLEAPFVGRRAELRMLKDFHVATGAERRPRLVSIMGQAGIGKTRLVWEFQKYMDGVTEVVYWHQGRSPAYGEGISFWALAEMVRGRAGIVEGEDAEASQQKLSASVQQFVTDADERAWVEPALRQLLGLEPPGDQDQERLFAAWRTFFERIAEQGVVVLVFEDLQWADSGLLDFIEHLLDWSRDRPIYLISLARPEILDRRPNWGAGRRNFTSLVLEPLNDEEMRELMAGLVPGLPEQVVSHVLQRAEGIPLYAVETVRTLVAEGLVAVQEGVYRPVGDLTELSVPPSLQALIASRLDALEAADRSLLQAAAVIGKTFSVEALAAVSGDSAEEVGRRLRGLVRRELLTLEADPRSPERGQYSFVQSVIREVAYGTLARRDRRRLHIAAARYFEALTDEGIAGALAEHYVAAYRAQPEGPEGQAVAAQARVALRGAADRARSLGSYIQAMRFLEQAMEVTTDPVEERELRSAAADAGWQGGLVEEPLHHAERALELARSGPDSQVLLSTIVLYAHTLWANGRGSEALALLEPTLEAHRDMAVTPEFVRLGAEVARSYMMMSRSEDSIRTVDEFLPLAERLELTRETLGMIVTRGAVVAALGRPREATAILLGAVEMAASHGFGDVELRSRVNLSYASANEDPQLAFRVAREGWDLVRRLGLRGYFYGLGNAADGAVRLGEWDWAIKELEEAAASLETDLTARIHLARFRGLRGEDVDADMRAISERLSDTSELQWRSTILDAHGSVVFAQGDPARALEMARASYTINLAPDNAAPLLAARAAAWIGDVTQLSEALEVQEQVPGRVTKAGSREGQAALAALDGRRAEAIAGFREAIRLWRDLGMVYDVALASLNFVKLVGGKESQTAAEEAREIFTRLGAQPLLAQLDAAVAESASAAPSSRAAERAGETEHLALNS